MTTEAAERYNCGFKSRPGHQKKNKQKGVI